MDTQKKREFAYILGKHIDCDTLHKLEHEDSRIDLTDVAEKLIETHSPSWVYYYIYEADEEPESYVPVAGLISNDTIQEVAEDYAELESKPINLARPGEYDWMQEDPMEPHREAYEERRESIKNAIETVFTDKLTPIADEDAVEAFAEDQFDSINIIEWEANLENHPDSNDEEVAERLLNSIRPLFLADNLKRYIPQEPEMDDISELADKLEKALDTIDDIDERYHGSTST